MPPQDIAAEQCVLGSMLLSKDAIADVVEEIRGPDFYRPAHETVYEAVLDLYGRGEPADAVTVAAELQRKGELARIGGAPYLHTLIASVPSAANAGYYAVIVREKAILRRLVEAGTKITQIGYAGDGDVDDVVDRAQAEIYSVTDKRSSEDYAVLGEIMESALDEIEAIGSRGGQMVGVPTGFTDLDALTNGLHPGQLIVVAARPGVGKSALALDFARAASVKHGLASVIFSLEMSRTEITMRLLSAEARVPLHHMRQGSMTDDDWARMARRMGEVSGAPLFIDDSPNMTLMEIRAKCRRLRQRNDLRLIVLDYIQLMTSGKRVESRQVEVAEFSRNLKLLAKELGVPVVALSQLNRGPEQRTDKRPMLSDLRESGCLTADTRVLRADTGQEVALGELLASGARDVPVWSLDERLKLVPRTMTHVFSSGVKEVFRLRLASGREIKATGNHPFLTYDGWKALREIASGARLAVARHVPPPLQITPRGDDEVATLAHLLGDGSHEKFVPAGVYSLPKRQIGLFLRHLWSTDGCVHRDAAGQVRIYYATTSRRLADDVARLLLRFNVFTRIRTVRKEGYRDSYHVHVVGAENQLRFVEDVGVHGARGAVAAEVLPALRAVTANPNVDTVPKDVWDRVREVLAERKVSHRQFAAAMGPSFSGSTMWKHAPSRTRLAKVASVLDCADLDVLATNDVLWDTVVSVESLGEQEVYDATVLGTHNFVADGVAVHNSIEQDADMVILLHREDAYERESSRPGEADFIVAKHRNGPTANITVAFQGHYSRFVDMAQG
ncbi:replicative DNA helicase [Actinopolymorpha sp. NPDC004070]|uniref:replicative DNA helicase n=1 Tax=Actinopolymorpha sp. NPDC004070 TaxID=3154548 RepID=UPI0033A63F18